MSNICGSLCSSVFMFLLGRWVVWYSGLLWLVVLAVVSRCDLMCRLIRLRTCWQSDPVGCLSVHWEAQLTVLKWG